MTTLEARLRNNRDLRRRIEPLHYWSIAFGIDAIKFAHAVKGVPVVLREYLAYRRQSLRSGLHERVRLSAPNPGDRYADAGTARGHYFHQDLLVARRIFQRQPQRHLDIGSRIDGFVAHVATFRPLEVLDIRAMTDSIPNVHFRQCDLMEMPDDLIGCCDSLSCLHALEHFGLGRYGDPINPNGHRQGFANLSRILRSQGMLYLSLPIGPERVEFNGHRVFAIRSILEMSRDQYTLEAFSYVDDRGDLHMDVPLDDARLADQCGCHYGCGIFELRKR